MTFDEVNPTLLASDFLQSGYRNYTGEFFPAFFPNIDKYSLGTTVYIQMVTLLLFGRSALAVKLTSVLFGLIGALGLTLALRNIFRLRYWWAGLLILSLLPAWFHHSRTAYETVFAVSFYGGLLYFYLLYRHKSPGYLYVTMLMAALAFYAYAPARLYVPLTILLLFVSDIRYHWAQRVIFWRAFLLGLLLALPYMRFQANHPSDTNQYLNNLVSYWTADISLWEKVSIFVPRYLLHLSPMYWFTPNYDMTDTDGLLHIMKGYGHFPLYLLPFLVWGLLLALCRKSASEYRTVLVAFLVTPVAAAIVLSPSSITRALGMVIPVAMLMTFGLDDLFQRIEPRLRLAGPRAGLLLSLTVFLVLGSINFVTLYDALNNSTRWFDNIGDSGVQFGATRLFPVLEAELQQQPDATVIMSPTWAMNVDLLARLFLGDDKNIRVTSIYDLARNKYELPSQHLLVVTEAEYQFAVASPKFSNIRVIRTIPYDVTRNAFYILHLEYSPQIDQLLAADFMERSQLQTAQIMIDGQPVTVNYTRGGGGPIEQTFDGLDTLYKTDEVNPALFELLYPEPRLFGSIFIIHGSSPIRLTATFYDQSGAQVAAYMVEFHENGENGNRLTLDSPIIAQKVTLSVMDLSQHENGIVHIWDIQFTEE
jgi:4-amino-4-deoxy-L-arabinose transferase-like glycosyltransferase